MQIKPDIQVKLNQFRPRKYQVPLLDALENKGYKRAIAIWPRRCLSGDTYVITANGKPVQIKNIRIGDNILAWDGSKIVRDKVVHVWQTHDQPCVATVARHFPDIITSRDHKFLNSRLLRGDPTYSFDAIFDIKPYQDLHQYTHAFEGAFEDIKETQLAACLGLYAKKQGNLPLTIEGARNRSLDLILQLCKELFNAKPKFINRSVPSRITYDDSKLLEFVQEWKICEPAYRRMVPENVWNGTRTNGLAYLTTLVGCHGTLVHRRHKGLRSAVYSTNEPSSNSIVFNLPVSEHFAWQVYYLMRKYGIIAEPPVSFTLPPSQAIVWRIYVIDPVGIKILLGEHVVPFMEARQFAMINDRHIYRERTHMIRDETIACPFNVYQAEQVPLYDLETEQHHNFIANGYIVHNSGKDIVSFNYMLRAALHQVGVYFYIFPTYSQARKVIWDSITNDGRRFLDFIPKELVAATNSSEMKITLVNSSIIQLLGSDNIDSIVGTNPRGIIFSEYALQDPRAYQFLRPVLTANQGWALFESTPRGKNHFWDLYQIALANPKDWFVQKLTVDDTQHIDLAEIERERQSGEMSDDLIMQEYFVSFDLGVEGAYYGKYLDKARVNDRITMIPYESAFKVHTAWDLGMRDSTTIIFFQVIGQTLRIIDCYENSKQGLEHYAKILASKDYVYGKHIAPHDIAVTELGTGISRIEKARQLGISFTVAPNLPIEDGIEAVRSQFSKLWFDEKKTQPLLKALENYRQEFDVKHKVYKNRPLHDWSSHWADALRYMCVSLHKTSDGLTPQELDRRFNEAVYGNQSKMPQFFRDDKPFG